MTGPVVPPAPLVRLEGITKVFDGSGPPTTAVRDVSLEVGPGEMVLLMGPSGSGKTTLLTLIAGLVRPTSGRVILFGRPVEERSARELQALRAGRIGFVFQTFLLLDALTVAENVEVVLRFGRTRRAERAAKARALLGELGVGHLAGRFPAGLSQGEKQRVAIARALANGAGLVIADEPTGSLETRQAVGIIELLREQARRRNAAVVVASHDLRLKDHADRTLYIRDGALARFDNETPN
ncbi:MAG: ABC transporter ATP-binding protein [Acidobacteria bacterium]|jgi:putative ABC transport system ATP-binding protein|nr:ABC transporter ATP-binding protein [Acidobacteriota bacterium]